MAVKKLIQSKKAWLSVVLVLVTLGFTFGLFGGCGVDYNTPASLTETPNALIDEAKLKEWEDLDLVNGSGYNNVVILDVNTDTTAYLAEHLSGAYCVLRSEVTATRTEGVGVSTQFMVPDGAAMDAIIQRTGIGPNTTIVIVSQTNLQTATYAYFAFRYWGFPKNRLKVLGGTMAQWKVLPGGNPLSTDNSGVAQTPLNSGYSVTQNPALRDDLRISFPEMIEIVEGGMPNSVILTTTTPNYASFRTTILGSVSFPHISSVMVDNFEFQEEEVTNTISNNLTGVGGGSTMNHVVYCNSGYFAVPVFFAIDGILGWPIYYYDGGWLQWGQMIDENQAVAPGVGLDVNSPWRTDIPTRSTGIPPTYSAPAGWLLPVTPLSFDATVNEIEQEDARYMDTGVGGGSGGGGTPGC